MSAGKRPRCITCGKRLGRYIRTVTIPHDLDVDDKTDVEGWIRAAPAERIGFHGLGEADFEIVDSVPRIRDDQAAAAGRFIAYAEMYREAEQALAPGSNESVLSYRRSAWQDLLDRGPPTVDAFPARVRIWIRGEYGPDARSLFHSGECAQRWAIMLARELRAAGRI